MFHHKLKNRGCQTAKTIKTVSNPVANRHLRARFCRVLHQDLAKTRVSRNTFSLGHPAKTRLKSVSKKDTFWSLFSSRDTRDWVGVCAETGCFSGLSGLIGCGLSKRPCVGRGLQLVGSGFIKKCTFSTLFRPCL